jgi:putative membrane-bound dehydrogenase-like protein
MSFPQVALLLLVLGAAHAAEPSIAPEQMPRVPPTEPDQAAATFALRPGFTAELVAAEPLIASPVALDVDELGRAYVVEMRDYSERRPEQLGRIKRLEDTDGDGRYDKATVFLAGLPWPTAVTCWNGGVFIGATPDLLYAKDTDGDGVADMREVIFTGFASDYAPYATNKLNVQALLNSFHWVLDCRIHGATSMSGGKVRLVDSEFTRRWRGGKAGEQVGKGAGEKNSAAPPLDLRGRDFSFDPRTLELRAEPGGGQHGMAFDDTGRKFVCSNSDHLQLIAFSDTGVPANPFHELPPLRHSIAADGPSAEVFRRSPDEPWRVLRTRWRVAGLVEGPIEGGGRPSGYFTGATGVTIYRGDAYGDEFAGDAFIADCGSNLIHRKRLRASPDGILLVGERAADEAKSEFLASTDNWFRPVQFFNAPDGCLWVVDMYRETIEHPWSLPPNLKQHLDLDAGRERGRLWRIAPNGFKAQSSKLKVQTAKPAELVNLLGHPNAWQRDTASRRLVELGSTNALPGLRALLRNSPKPVARLHALNVLAALGGADEATLTLAAGDRDAAVRRHAVVLLAQAAVEGVERPPSPRPSPPERGGNVASPTAQAPVSSDNQARTNRSPSPGGEGRGEGGPDTIIQLLTRAAATEANPLVRLELAFALARVPAAVRLEPLAQLIRTGPAFVRSAAIHSAGGVEADLWAPLAKTAREPQFTEAGAALAELAKVLGRRGELAGVQPVLAALQQWQGTALAPVVAHGLVAGLALERRSSVVRELPQPWPESFAQAWEAASRPVTKPKTTPLPPPNPDRLAVLEKLLPALDLAGDPQRGAALFRERCATCHAFRGEGTNLGPDLASVIANGPNRLLVSILDPNREVAPNFAAWTAETKDGESVTGLLVQESASAVTLKVAGGTETTLARSRVTDLRQDGRSLMPEGLEAGLTHADVASLLAWLLGR